MQWWPFSIPHTGPTTHLPNRLDELHISEMSAVDLPAHLHPGWLVLKSAHLPGTTSTTKETNMPINLEALDPEVRAFIEELEARANALVESTDSLAKAAGMCSKCDKAMAKQADGTMKCKECGVVGKSLATDPEPEPDVDTPEALAKALSTLPEPLRKAWEENTERAAAAERRAEANEKVTKSLIEKAEVEHFTKVAAELPNLPSTTPETLVPILRDIAKATSPETFEKLGEILKAADTAIETGDMFRQLGTPGAHTSGDAYSKLEGIAKALVNADSTLTFEAAFSKATQQNPDLYVEHRDAVRATQNGA